LGWNFREGCEGTIGEMTAIPKVDGGSVALVRNEHGVVDVDQRKGVEISGRVDEWGPDGEKAEVEGPEVFEGRAHMPERAGAN
jgi:hypothetical protein